MKVLNFGSLNLDYVYQVESILIPGETQASKSRQTFCGGKGLNQSIALAKAGIPVYHAGLIGEGGEPLLEVCKENGVNTEFIRQIPGPCGHTVIQVDENGQNCILLFGGSNRSMTKEFVDSVLDSFEEGDIILLQNEINELDYIIERAYEKHMMIILNPSPMNDKIKELPLNQINYFLLNEIEAMQILDMEEPKEIDGKYISGLLHQKFPEATIVLTLGSEGSVCISGDEYVEQSIYKVKTVDTTAAGDTYTGYFIAGILNGKTIKEAMDTASKASAIAVSRQGAAPSIPCLEEVEEYKN